VDLSTNQTIGGVKTFTSPIAGSVTGNAANVTGVVAVANGGTGSATQNFVDLTTNQTVAGIKTFSSPIAGSVTGNAANVTGIVAVANGGTGSATQNFVDLSTNQTIGGVKTFTSPIAGSVTGNAANVTGTVAVANGGTGLTAAGTKGQVLTSTGAGLAWSLTYSVGYHAELGGYVFYVTPDGNHGLVVATQNQCSDCSWYNAENEINNPANHNPVGQQFTNWRLPTFYELGLLYVIRVAVGGFSTNIFWSSTATGTDNAEYINFSNGLSTPARSKAFPSYVRAVRSF
jgi:hypothetical protein